MREVCQDSRGHTLFVEENEVGGHRYWSDEIGGGVMIWDTSLVSEEMLQIAIEAEQNRITVEKVKALMAKEVPWDEEQS